MLLNVSNSVISYCVRSALHPNRIKLIFYLFLVETDEDQNSGHDKKSSTAVADSFRRMFNEKHGNTMDLKILMMQIFSAWAKYTSTGESDEEKEVKTVEDEDGDGDTIGEVGGEDDDADNEDVAEERAEADAEEEDDATKHVEKVEIGGGSMLPSAEGGDAEEGKLKKEKEVKTTIAEFLHDVNLSGFGDTLVHEYGLQSMAVPVDELFDLLDSIGSHSAHLSDQDVLQEVGLNQAQIKDFKRAARLHRGAITELQLEAEVAAEAAALKAEEEARLFAEQVSAAAEAARIKAEEEATAAAALKAEEEARLRAEQVSAAAEAARIKAEEEAAAAAALKAEEEARLRAEHIAAAAEAARIKAEEEAATAAALKAEEEARLRAEQVAAAAEAARIKVEEEAARVLAEQEAAAAAEAARIKAEEEAAAAEAERIKAEEEAAAAEAERIKAEGGNADVVSFLHSCQLLAFYDDIIHDFGIDNLEELLDEEHLTDDELKDDIGMNEEQVAAFRKAAQDH
jgi:hypothetical protein